MSGARSATPPEAAPDDTSWSLGDDVEDSRLTAIVLTLPARWQHVFIAHAIEGKPPKVVRTETGVPRGTFQHWTCTERWRAAEREVLAIQAKSRINTWRRLVLAADEAVTDVLGDDTADARDRLKAAEIVYDRSGLTSGATLPDPDAQDGETPPLHTPEGRAALVAELRSLPRELLREALSDEAPTK